MKIALNQSEVVAAIRGYVAAQGIDMAGKQLDVTFTSGRKGNGLTADLDIYTQAEASAVVVEDVVVDDVPEVPAPEAPVAVAPTEETGSLFG
jgi:hypothetical protein